MAVDSIEAIAWKLAGERMRITDPAAWESCGFPKSAEVFKAAEAIIAAGRLLRLAPGIFDVVGSPKKRRGGVVIPGEVYRTTRGSCSCPSAIHRAERCKHQIAVELYEEAIAIRLRQLRAEREEMERRAFELLEELSSYGVA